jgi:hypothetical protein
MGHSYNGRLQSSYKQLTMVQLHYALPITIYLNVNKEGCIIMAAINKDVTEQQLYEAYQAVKAIQTQKGHTEQDAQETASLLSYAVFRGVITLDSLIGSIVRNAERVFVH